MNFIARYVYTYKEFVFLTEATASQQNDSDRTINTDNKKKNSKEQVNKELQYINWQLYTEQNYKCNTFVFNPFFLSWTQKSKTFSRYTKGLFISNIVHKSV